MFDYSKATYDIISGKVGLFSSCLMDCPFCGEASADFELWGALSVWGIYREWSEDV